MNEKKKHNRYHGKNHNKGRQGDQKKQKKPPQQEPAPEIALPEFDFISPASRVEEKKIDVEDVVLSQNIIAEIEADIIPPVVRNVEPPQKKEEPPKDEEGTVDIIGIRFKKAGRSNLKDVFLRRTWCSGRRDAASR